MHSNSTNNVIHTHEIDLMHQVLSQGRQLRLILDQDIPKRSLKKALSCTNTNHKEGWSRDNKKARGSWPTQGNNKRATMGQSQFEG